MKLSNLRLFLKNQLYNILIYKIYKKKRVKNKNESYPKEELSIKEHAWKNKKIIWVFRIEYMHVKIKLQLNFAMRYVKKINFLYFFKWSTCMQGKNYILFLVQVKYMHAKNNLYFIVGSSEVHACKDNII